IDPDGSSFTYSAVASAPGTPDVEGPFPISAAVRSALLARSVPIVAHDTDSDFPEGAKLFCMIGAKALIVAPVVKGGRLVAVAGVHMLTPRQWTVDEIELVDVVAERLWEAMELARVSRELRKREEEYWSLFELSAVGVAQSDPETGRFVRANRRF